MQENREAIEQRVIQQITPTTKQRAHLLKTIKELQKKINQHLNNVPYDVAVELVGSTAKDTYLATHLDIDFFLVFSPDTPQESLAQTARKIGKRILTNTEECYAEHPYIRGIYNTYETEIVPCYRIKDAQQKITAVDRTPLHTIYIKNNIKENQKQEVRLFKQFLRGINCYGAEAEIEGFSGYLCELLILKYETFDHLIRQAADWKAQTILSLTTSNPPRFDTPLVFIDPVDDQRNVASALKEHKFNLFVHACNEYLRKPRYTFFFPNSIKPWQRQKIQQKIQHDHYIGIHFKKPSIISENLYPQIRKTKRAITDLCTQHDFIVLDSTYCVYQNDIYIILKIEKEKLSSTTQHGGPPTHLKKNAEEFKNKWLNHPRTKHQPFVQNNRWYVSIKRVYTSIETLIQEKLPDISLGKDIQQIINHDFTVLSKKALLDAPLQSFWTDYLDPRMPWER